jgi:hypothetical protein
MSLVQKFDETGSVIDNPKGVVEHKRTGRTAGNHVTCSKQFKQVQGS